MQTADFSFDLPDDLIAQEPAADRDGSRLMVVHRGTGSLEHRRFRDILDYLDVGDLLVANRSRVVPARLRATKSTGGAVELLLLRSEAPNVWTALCRPSRKLREGMVLHIVGSPLQGTLGPLQGEGQWEVRFSGAPDVAATLRATGTLALPPYIHNSEAPPDRYQTVYADRDGSIAAPTAGLHFTPQLLQQVRDKGVHIAFVTLHVGIGTFQPVKVDTITDHRMHAEWGEVDQETCSSANMARDRGRKLISVGTTTTRLLESSCLEGRLQPFHGETDRFIYPGYRFQAVDALVTNFHLPRSTLFMLVSAFAGRDLMLRAYREAIAQRYRFFSFGDAMLIL